jgi:hypothetical protein
MRISFRFCALALTCLAAWPAGAELPPNHQRLAELRAVLNHPGVAAAFGVSELVERVEYVRTDLYRVTVGRCHIDVAIIGLPMPRGVVGGRRFEARPGRRVCPRRAR